jgi:hypothetical protein
MINILDRSKNTAGKFGKSSGLDELYSAVCKLLGVDSKRLSLVLVEENQNKVFLERETEYINACDKSENLTVIAYIKPKTITTIEKTIAITLGTVLYLLAAIFLNLPYSVFAVFYFVVLLVLEVYEIFSYLLFNFTGLLYWAPFVFPFVYMSHISYHCLTHIISKKTLPKSHITYWVFFTLNLIPNILGFLSSMIGIFWIVFVVLDLVLHKPRPLSPKDMDFFVILVGYLVTTVARIIYFY